MKVVLTGAKGVIGTVIRREVPGVKFIEMDLPEIDLRKYRPGGGTLEGWFYGADAVIHLAWNTEVHNWESPWVDYDDLVVVRRVKVYVETLGRMFASRGLEVICIRFGAVRADNRVPDIAGGEVRFLSHRDLGTLITKVLAARGEPGHFTIVNAVSLNTVRVHDVSNPFGWMPQDDSENFARGGK